MTDTPTPTVLFLCVHNAGRSQMALGWFNHRQWHRSVLGMVGPAIVLVASFTVAEKLLYVGLATMVAVSVWDFVSPANRRCGPDGCAVPPKHA